ncbi:MAG: hypothetical protein LKM38_26185 [Pseudomonas veronii]|nr:hypothetical protein [Pseudomonas veronii]
MTTHPAADGNWVWYMGGDIAEADGVARTPQEQIATAQHELALLLPWIDMSHTEWATLRVERAEPLQSGLTRPDNAFLAEQGRLLVGWPTKLALAPDFADRVLHALERDGIPTRACHPAARAAQTPPSANRPGSNCCHEPAHPARPAPPAGQYRPAGVAAGPGHRQARSRPRGEIPQRLPDSR